MGAFSFPLHGQPNQAERCSRQRPANFWGKRNSGPAIKKILYLPHVIFELQAFSFIKKEREISFWEFVERITMFPNWALFGTSLSQFENPNIFKKL